MNTDSRRSGSENREMENGIFADRLGVKKLNHSKQSIQQAAFLDLPVRFWPHFNIRSGSGAGGAGAAQRIRSNPPALGEK